MYLEAMKKHDQEIVNDFFPYSPNYIVHQSGEKLNEVIDKLKSMVSDYDLVHIQHEFSFYKGSQIKQIVEVIKRNKIKLISTIHTKPILRPNTGSMMSPRGAARKVKNRVINTKYLEAITPLSLSDLVIVHNEFTKSELIKVGFDANKILIKAIPVPVVEVFLDKYTAEIAKINTEISRKKGDIIIATVGYLNPVKGTMHAVKAMTLLPGNYKLLVLGGVHPKAHNDEFLDDVSDFIVKHQLQKRVYISGFIKDDLLLNTLVANSDIVIYPYLRSYASSSAALNNAFAAGKPVIAFPAPAFKEINKTEKHMVLCESFSYYDLVREIDAFDPEKIKAWSTVSDNYRLKNSYVALSKELIELYKMHTV